VAIYNTKARTIQFGLRMSEPGWLKGEMAPEMESETAILQTGD